MGGDPAKDGKHPKRRQDDGPARRDAAPGQAASREQPEPLDEEILEKVMRETPL